MSQAEVLIAGLLVAVAGLGALARLLSVPYPIVLVIGGAVLGFVVIFFTLVVQGLSLPARACARPRPRSHRSTTSRTRTGHATSPCNDCARSTSTASVALAARAGKITDDEDYESRSLAWQQMLHLVLAAQRDELLRMRDDGELSNEAMNRILRELDLEESRLEI